MKTLITQVAVILAFFALTTLASATDLKVPGKAKPAAKSPPSVVQPDARMACLTAKAQECDAKNWTKLGKKACYRVKARQCR